MIEILDRIKFFIFIYIWIKKKEIKHYKKNNFYFLCQPTRIIDLNADYIDMPFGRGGPGTPGMPGSNSRTKRMRTSFKHHQLRTMKSYFAINHNPDAKDLKQLSQKTGLPKRVLQVSFDHFCRYYYSFSWSGGYVLKH